MQTSPGSESGPARKLDALARRAGWALLWERAWPSLAWTGALVAMFLAASWFGLWFAAPRFARIGGLALFALALFATLAPLARLRRPSRAQTLARLDGDAPDAHRPASDFDDRLANGMGDETTNALWALHRARLARRVDRLSLAPPTPGMAKRDPRALRFAAVLLALAAGWLAGSERYARVAAAFDWRGASASAAPARVDAWIDPPAYTNKPPLLLKVVGQEKPESVVAPENSVLIVRADPRLVETRIEGALSASTPDAPKPAAGAPSERRFVIHGDGKFTLLQGGSPMAAFAISATPSGKPTIALVDPPQSNLTGSLTLHYSIADPYGVAGAEAQFALPNAAGAPPTHSLVEAPKLGLPLPPGNGVGDARTTSDLSEHPWAGAKVIMTLQATDVAGESGQSAPVALTLPQRHFSKPLARALVEQRRGLILDPDHNRSRLAKALDALMIAPEAFDTAPGVYLGLRTAKSTLDAARTDKDLVEVADLLWAMALQIEDGDASQALRDLRAAEQKLREALQRGASDEEIKALTKELRERAEEYMRELAQQNPSADPDDAPLDAQDLESMLDRMEDTARNGARDDAEAMLDQMQDMFENLKSGRAEPQDPAERELRKQMSELDKLLRDQQALRDKTFKRSQKKRSSRAQPDGGAQPQDQQEQGSEPLDQEQGDLRDRLAELQRRLKALGLQGEKGFDDAEGDMSEAEGDLKGDGPGSGDSDSPDSKGAMGRGGGKGDGDAVGAQGRAMQALREGAQGLQRQMQGAGGQSGRSLTMGRRGQRNQPGDDPLGRGPNGERGASEGQLHEGPAAAERARRVLQELRRRLADPNRPTDERDYLERLLRGDAVR